MPSLHLDDLATEDRSSESVDMFRIGRILEKQGNQMAGIALRLLPESVLGDDGLPFRWFADEEGRSEAKPLLGLFFQQAFQLRGCLVLGLKNQIAALEQRSRLSEAQLREQIAQVRHRDHLVTA